MVSENLTPQLRFTLLAARASIDALLATDMAAVQEGCQHADKDRVETTAMGGPRSFFCKSCRNEIEIEE